jgi:hypothetical protein
VRLISPSGRNVIGGWGAEMPHMPIVARVDALIRHACAWRCQFSMAGFLVLHDLVK